MKILFAALAFASAATSAFAAGDSAPLAPFHAEYTALRNGDDIGRTTLDLADNHDGTWSFSVPARS